MVKMVVSGSCSWATRRAPSKAEKKASASRAPLSNRPNISIVPSRFHIYLFFFFLIFSVAVHCTVIVLAVYCSLGGKAVRF